MKAVRDQIDVIENSDRQCALKALHELQNMFKDDSELQSMSEDDIVQEIKEIRREMYDARSR